MKGIKNSEKLYLATICKQNNVPVKMLNDLLDYAQEYNYENINERARINNYDKHLSYYINRQKSGD